jgi:autotransporter-associated beta strand protein
MAFLNMRSQNIAGSWWLVRKKICLLASLCACLLLPIGLCAQTWIGTTSVWNTAGNWSGGVPTATTAATFGSSSNYNLTFTGAAAASGLTFNGGSAYSFATNTYVLSIYGSGIANQTANTEVFNAPVTVAAAQTWNNTSTGGLTFKGAVSLGADLTLNGSGNISVTGTLTNSGGNRTIFNDSTGLVTFGNINLSESTTPRTLTLSGTGNTTVSGVIADGGTSAGSLTKAGTGTLILSGANTYTGATNINAGVLSIQNPGALGTSANTSNTTVASGATLQIANGITTTNIGTLILNGDGTGSGALQGVGNSAWNGAISLNSDATIYSSTAGSIFNLDADYTNAYTLALGNHTLTIDGPGDVWANQNVGVIGDTGGLIKNGAGTLTFFGYNTFYTGATIVNAGSLELVVGPFTAGWYGINGSLTIGTGPANPSAAGSVNVNIWASDHAYAPQISGYSYANQISPNSAVTINSDGALNVGSSTTMGTLTLNGGLVKIWSGQTVTPSGSITSNVNSAHETSLITGGQLALAASTTFTVARDSTLASDLTVSSSISGGTLVKQGAGILTLSSANTYTGGTTINAGVLNIQNSAALSTGATTVASGAALQMQGGITVTGVALTLNGIGVSIAGALENVSGNNTWTGAITLGSATRINSDAGTLTISGNIVGNTQNLTVGGAGNTSIGGVIGTTSGSLTKDGAGILTLSGANTYTGTTTISQGTVQLGASDRLANTSGVSIGAPGTLNLNGFSQQIGALTAANGATLDFGPQTGANTFVFGTYTGPSSGVLVVNDWQNGTDTLASSIGGQPVSSIYISGYGAAQEAAGTSGTLYGSDYLLTPVIQTAVVWNGSTNVNWNTVTNWVGGSIPGTAQIAVFDSTGAGRPAVTLDGNNTIAGLRFDTAAPSYTITGGNTLTLSGTLPYIQQQSANNQTLSFTTLVLDNNTVADITGSGNLAISSVISGGYDLIRDGTGTGKLILTGANTFTGGVFINNGIVQAGSTAALGTGATTISAGAGLELNGTISPTNAISVSGTGVGEAGAIHNVGGANTLSGTITETGATTIAADTGTTLNLTGNLTGANQNTTFAGPGAINANQITTGTGGVTINSGTVTFQGGATANTYTGTTTVNNAILNLNKNANVTAVAGNLTISGSTVNETASGQIANTATVTLNSGAFNLGTNATQTVAEFDSSSGSTATLNSGSILTINDAGNGVINGTIAGAGSLTTSGTGSVTLSGANTYTGATNITAGVLNIQNNTALGTTAGGTTVASGAALQMQGGITVTGEALTLSGTGVSDNGALRNISGSNTWTGAITLGSNSRINSDAGALTISGAIGGAAHNLTIGGAGSTTINGVIGTTTGSLTKDGTGTLILYGNNTYNGGTSINGGSLQLGTSQAIASGTAVSIASSATLNLNGYTQTVGAFSGAGTVQLGGGTLVAGSGNASSTFSGIFSNDPASVLEKTGTGTLTLGNNMNLSAGALVLNGGTLNLGGYNSTFGSLSVTADSVIDFGTGGASILDILNSVSVASGAILTIDNWTDTVDFFYSLYDPGVAIGQIVFSGYSPTATNWNSFDTEITPVPEPATYGAVLMLIGLSLGLVAAWRSRRSNPSYKR